MLAKLAANKSQMLEWIRANEDDVRRSSAPTAKVARILDFSSMVHTLGATRWEDVTTALFERLRDYVATGQVVVIGVDFSPDIAPIRAAESAMRRAQKIEKLRQYGAAGFPSPDEWWPPRENVTLPPWDLVTVSNLRNFKHTVFDWGMRQVLQNHIEDLEVHEPIIFIDNLTWDEPERRLPLVLHGRTLSVCPELQHRHGEMDQILWWYLRHLPQLGCLTALVHVTDTDFVVQAMLPHEITPPPDAVIQPLPEPAAAPSGMDALPPVRLENLTIGPPIGRPLRIIRVEPDKRKPLSVAKQSGWEALKKMENPKVYMDMDRLTEAFAARFPGISPANIAVLFIAFLGNDYSNRLLPGITAETVVAAYDGVPLVTDAPLDIDFEALVGTCVRAWLYYKSASKKTERRAPSPGIGRRQPIREYMALQIKCKGAPQNRLPPIEKVFAEYQRMRLGLWHVCQSACPQTFLPPLERYGWIKVRGGARFVEAQTMPKKRWLVIKAEPADDGDYAMAHMCQRDGGEEKRKRRI